MANTGYISSSAINQVFTSGPYSGSFVTSSFSSGSTLNGPTLNYKQLFISGTIESLAPCATLPIYSRVAYDPIACPPGGCTIPILTSVALSSSCTTIYDYKYNITYNSASIAALYTKIQYSTTANFSSNVATSSFITNSNPTIPPININNLPSLPSSNYTTIYFRAFNSCSIGTTSSYSNILSASCNPIPPPPFEPFYYELINNSKSPINFKLDSTTYTVNNNNSFSVISSNQLASLSISIIGTSPDTPPTKITNLSTGDTKPQFKIIGSSTSTFSSLISTKIIPQIDSGVTSQTNLFDLITTPPPQYYGDPNFTGLNTWILHQSVESTNLTFPIETVFASDKIDNTVDVIINIDRHEWVSTGKITFTVNPLTTQYYQYDPILYTCVLSGTPITLADGSTTPIDNLRGGDRVLSPSILTLPPNNDFDLSNWAINKLILTEGTAIVTGNNRYQVNEVYSINNGTLTTTSSHNHLFKQNGTWGIKTTSYLMIGDCLSDRNGEEILIESIEILTGDFTVFDLDVEENDLYIANGILTHNKITPK
jgi:hypothetical protein